MESLYPFHPRLVHFPMALLLVGAAFVVAGVLRGRAQWSAYGRLSLLLGWVSALLAAFSGLIDQSRAPQDALVTTVINQHITAGIAVIIIFGLALYWPLRDKALLTDRRRRWAYLALLALGALLVIVEGSLGGQLVFKLGVGQ